MTAAHYKGGHPPGNDLGLHYTALPPIVASCPYSDQLLVTRKFWSPGANRPSQASGEPNTWYRDPSPASLRSAPSPAMWARGLPKSHPRSPSPVSRERGDPARRAGWVRVYGRNHQFDLDPRTFYLDDRTIVSCGGEFDAATVQPQTSARHTIERKAIAVLAPDVPG